MIFPLMSRRQSGVEVVPQLLLSNTLRKREAYEQSCPEIEGERVSARVVIVIRGTVTDRTELSSRLSFSEIEWKNNNNNNMYYCCEIRDESIRGKGYVR
jgi:hypothetical protein